MRELKLDCSVRLKIPFQMEIGQQLEASPQIPIGDFQPVLPNLPMYVRTGRHRHANIQRNAVRRRRRDHAKLHFQIRGKSLTTTLRLSQSPWINTTIAFIAWIDGTCA